MKAAVLHQVGDERLDIRDDVSTTAVGAGKVKVRIKATGVCHSDLSAMNGTIPVAVPAVLGHEGAGEVIEVGPGVTSLAEGDHVVVCWSPQCGVCKDCVNGQPQLCMAYMINAFSDAHFQIGTTPMFGMAGAGTFAEELILLEQGAVKIGKDVPHDVASLLGCGVMTGVGAAINAAKVEPGSQRRRLRLRRRRHQRHPGRAHRRRGDDPRRRHGRQQARPGPSSSAPPTRSSPRTSPRRSTSSPAAQASTTGSRSSAGPRPSRRRTTRPVAAARPSWSASAGADDMVELSAFDLFYAEKNLRGTYYGSANIRRDFPRLVALWRSGQLDLEGMITHRLALDDVNDAFGRMQAGEAIRQVITFD